MAVPLAVAVAVVLLVLGSAAPACAILGLPIEIQGGKAVIKRTAKPGGSTTSTIVIPAVGNEASRARTHVARPGCRHIRTRNRRADEHGPSEDDHDPCADEHDARGDGHDAGRWLDSTAFGPAATSTHARASTHTSSAHKSQLSGAAIVAAVLAALIALGCLAWGVARMLAVETRRGAFAAPRHGRGRLPRVGHVGRIQRLGAARSLAPEQDHKPPRIERCAPRPLSVRLKRDDAGPDNSFEWASATPAQREEGR